MLRRWRVARSLISCRFSLFRCIYATRWKNHASIRLNENSGVAGCRLKIENRFSRGMASSGVGKMYKFLLASVVTAISLASGSALAADMASKAPPIATSSPAPAWNWSGFYVGGNVGYGVGRDPTVQTFGIDLQDTYQLAPAGWLAGAQAGYNSQFGNWVLGIEADWQWANQTDAACTNTCTPFAPAAAAAISSASTIKSFGTARARFGFAEDGWLWYVTGGDAWGSVDSRYSNVVLAPPGPLSAFGATQDRNGWVVGGGVETTLAGAWSAKLEYLYLDLGNVNATDPSSGETFTSTVRDHIIRLGLNYRFAPSAGFGTATGTGGSDAPLIYKSGSGISAVRPVSAARTVYDWTGFYVGANVGYGVARDPTQTEQIQTAPLGQFSIGNFNLAPAGIVAGPQIGGNWQIGNLVLGIEADWQWTSQEDHACRDSCLNDFNVTYDQSLKWFGTARARVGWAENRTLWYVTGGGAWGQVNDNFSLFSPLFGIFPSVNAVHDMSGWTAGGGVETALGGPWTAKLEYLYMDLGSVTDSYSAPFLAGTGTFSTTTHIRDNIVRVGLNYRFADPVAAGDPTAANILFKAPTHDPLLPYCIWCNWYVGVNGGDVYASNNFSTVATPIPDAALGAPAGVSEGLAALSTGSAPIGSTNAFIGGAQAGYNWQVGNFVPGIEADIEGFSRSGGSTTTTTQAVVVGVPTISTQTATMSTSYLGTLRGRLGLLVTPDWLPYLTGGLAYGGVKASDTLFQTGTNGFFGAGTASFVDTRLGWALGAGMEWMFAPRWSAKAEYLHYDLGYANFTNLPFSVQLLSSIYQTDAVSAHFSGDIVRLGVDYHFGWSGPSTGASY